jgi:hypothetical protein
MSLNLYGLVCEVFDEELFVFHFDKKVKKVSDQSVAKLSCGRYPID